MGEIQRHDEEVSGFPGEAAPADFSQIQTETPLEHNNDIIAPEEVIEAPELTPEELRWARKKEIIHELNRNWEAENGPMEYPMSPQEIERDKEQAKYRKEKWSGLTDHLRPEASDFYYGRDLSSGFISIPAKAERILIQRFPEYKKTEVPPEPTMPEPIKGGASINDNNGEMAPVIFPPETLTPSEPADDSASLDVLPKVEAGPFPGKGGEEIEEKPLPEIYEATVPEGAANGRGDDRDGLDLESAKARALEILSDSKAMETNPIGLAEAFETLTGGNLDYEAGRMVSENRAIRSAAGAEGEKDYKEQLLIQERQKLNEEAHNNALDIFWKRNPDIKQENRSKYIADISRKLGLAAEDLGDTVAFDRLINGGFLIEKAKMGWFGLGKIKIPTAVEGGLLVFASKEKLLGSMERLARSTVLNDAKERVDIIMANEEQRLAEEKPFCTQMLVEEAVRSHNAETKFREEMEKIVAKKKEITDLKTSRPEILPVPEEDGNKPEIKKIKKKIYWPRTRYKKPSGKNKEKREVKINRKPVRAVRRRAA